MSGLQATSTGLPSSTTFGDAEAHLAGVVPQNGDHVPMDRRAAGPRIVTPHPGEAARMLARAEPDAGWTAKRVQAQRLEAARQLAQRTHAVAVLEGEGTIIAAPDGRLEIAVTGGPALATAGSGDVLAGLDAALLARSFDAWDAARFAVHLHGLAGDLAAQRYPGCIVMDIADAIGLAMTAQVLHQPVPGSRTSIYGCGGRRTKTPGRGTAPAWTWTWSWS